MTQNINEIFLESVKKRFAYYKEIAEKAIEQVEPSQLFITPNADTNSIAMIVQHMAGNMLSRWTDFLTSDGEKEWRNRDDEFVPILNTKEEMMHAWNNGWNCFFKTLNEIKPTQLQNIIYIRKEAHTVLDAINRQLAHYPYHFGRVWCRDEFASQGLAVDMVQASVSYNRRAGTLRGMHFSRAPSLEAKLVRCTRGRVHDVILDLRPDSPSYMMHISLLLDEGSHNAIFVPPGVAHGFQTLVDDCDVFYMMTENYRADLTDGVRFDDPAFRIEWPLPVSCIAERDCTYPSYAPDGRVPGG